MTRTASGTRTALAQKQNLLTYSEQFDNAAWTKVSSSVTAYASDYPAGLGFTQSFQLKEDGTAGVTHELRTGSVQPANGVVTFSGFFKKSASDYIRIAGNGGASTLIVNLNTGIITPAGTRLYSRIESVGNGWYRVSLTYVATSAYPWCSVYLTIDGTTLVYDGTLGRINTLAVGLQLVQSNWPGPYVQTVASVVNTGNIRNVASPVLPVNKLVDGDMETAGVAAWTAWAGGTPTKETTNPKSGTRLLRLTYGGGGGWGASQVILTVGKRYRATGWGRSDGNRPPKISLGGGSFQWTGTTSTSWQPFDVVFAADGTGFYLGTTAGAGGQYVEFDDIQVIDLTATPMRLNAGTRLTA